MKALAFALLLAAPALADELPQWVNRTRRVMPAFTSVTGSAIVAAAGGTITINGSRFKLGRRTVLAVACENQAALGALTSETLGAVTDSSIAATVTALSLTVGTWNI